MARENIDVLNEVLDLNLTNVEREQAAGSFSVDLVAEDDSGNTVVIENQLERSNHDHLWQADHLCGVHGCSGRYLDSRRPAPRTCARDLVAERVGGDRLYLLKIEGIRIGDSPPAPLLTLIVGPSDEAREVGEAKKERAERYTVRRRFWTDLLDRAKQRSKLRPGGLCWGVRMGRRRIRNARRYVQLRH